MSEAHLSAPLLAEDDAYVRRIQVPASSASRCLAASSLRYFLVSWCGMHPRSMTASPQQGPGGS